jgi:hypothetical protein
MPKLLLSLFLSVGLVSLAEAQSSMPPCGPAGDLPDELSANVDDNARCFELRMYTAEPEQNGVGGIDNLHQRFREAEVAIFERLGAEVIAVWQRMDDADTLVWMLAYRNRDHRAEVWEAFLEDPEWIALREKYPVPISAEVYYMSPTDYSNLK